MHTVFKDGIAHGGIEVARICRKLFLQMRTGKFQSDELMTIKVCFATGRGRERPVGVKGRVR